MTNEGRTKVNITRIKAFPPHHYLLKLVWESAGGRQTFYRLYKRCPLCGYLFDVGCFGEVCPGMKKNGHNQNAGVSIIFFPELVIYA